MEWLGKDRIMTGVQSTAVTSDYVLGYTTFSCFAQV